MLDGEFDKKNAILELHPGAGGTESQDWALMLYRMYKRYAERHNFKFELIDYQEGTKETTIIFEYIIDAGEKTTIQTFKAISTTDCITIKTVESHSIQYIIQENPDETDELDYNVTLMVFNKEATK